MTGAIGQIWRTRGRAFVLALAAWSCAPIALGWTSQEQNTAAEAWGSSVYQGQPSQRTWAPQDYGYQQPAPAPQSRQRDNPWSVGPPGYLPPGRSPTPRPWSEAPSQDQERGKRRRDVRPSRPEAQSWEAQPEPGQEQGGYYGGYYGYGDGYYGAYPGYGAPYGGGFPGWGYDPYLGGRGPWSGGWPGGWGSPMWGMPFFGW